MVVQQRSAQVFEPLGWILERVEQLFATKLPHSAPPYCCRGPFLDPPHAATETETNSFPPPKGSLTPSFRSNYAIVT